jgi:hypothetical protein
MRARFTFQRSANVAAGVTLAALVFACAMPAGASAAPVKLPGTCEYWLKAGDGPLKAFCRQLNVSLKVAGPRYDATYSPAKQAVIARAVGAVARRSSMVVAVPAALEGPRLAVSLPIDGIKDFCKKSLKAVKLFARGAARFIPQARVLNCGLQGGLAAAGSYIAGANLVEILTATGVACIGINLPVFGKKT